MDLRLKGYPCGFSEEGADGGNCSDAATMGPAFYGGVFHPCGDMFKWRHAWGKQVQVGDLRCQLEVIDGYKSIGILICENVGPYGGAKCQPPYVPIP